MSQESETPPKVDSQGQQESTYNSQMDFEQILDACANMMSDRLKLENERHTESVTTVLKTEFKDLAIAIQNSKVFKVITPETDELNQNYSQNESEVVTPVTDELNQNYSQNEAGKAYYDTRGKRGLLCILQLEDDWKKGNKKDKDVLSEFFGDTLGFVVETYKSYDALDDKIKSRNDLTAANYYCLLICISGHGFTNGVITQYKKTTTTEGIEECQIIQWKQTDNIIKRFNNENISSLAGVPKIIILDTCRGSNYNFTVHRQSNDSTKTPLPDNMPTTDSDCITIHATTHGFKAQIPEEGSVGIQGVMEIFKKNWGKNHLEEMLIDARMNVATWSKGDMRQILEIQTTLLKRLMFEKFVV